MKLRRGYIILFAAILLFGSFFTGCSKTAGQRQELVINIGGEPTSLYPQMCEDVVSARVVNAIFEGLLRKGKDGRPMPGLAERWDTSSDKLVYTFYLRSATWADGTSVTAEDFKNAWLDALNPKPSNHEPARMANLLYFIKGAEEYNSGKGTKENVGIKAVEDKKLVVTLVKPVPYFPDLVSNSIFMPVNQAFYDKQPMDKDKTKYGTEASAILGNGPYKVDVWSHDNEITLVKNEKYWNSNEIKLDKVTFKMIKNNSSAFTAFKADEIDMVEITDERQKEEAQNLNADVESYETGATAYLGFNMKEAFLQNSHIRKSLAYAIDRESLIKKVLKDSSLPALGFVNPAIHGSKESFRKQAGNLFKDNDTKEAKILLAKGLTALGISKAPKITILLEDKESAKRDAQVYQEMWRKNLGLEVEIEAMDFDAMLGKIMEGNYQIALLQWGAEFDDPTAFLELFLPGSPYNTSYYENPRYDELLKQAEKEDDISKRMERLIEAEKTLIGDMAICPVYFPRNTYAVKSHVKGIVRGNWAIQDLDLYWAYIAK